MENYTDSNDARQFYDEDIDFPQSAHLSHNEFLSHNTAQGFSPSLTNYPQNNFDSGGKIDFKI